MDIKIFLENYEGKMNEKIVEQADKQLKAIKESDIIQRALNNAKNLFINELKGVNNELEKNGDMTLSKENFDSLSVWTTLDHIYTETTQHLLNEAKKSIERRQEKVHKILEDIQILCSYLTSPEEVTTILRNYNIINSEGKLNYDLLI